MNTEIPQLDPLTELGIALHRKIPIGSALTDWLIDEGGIKPFVDVLLARGFTWREISLAVHDLSRGDWSPGPDMVQSMYREAA